MSVPCPVSHVLDLSFGALTHNALLPPAVPAPVINASIEGPTPMLWPPGYAMNQNKFAKKVTHKSLWIAQKDHDNGMLIPHVTLPTAGNLLYAVILPFSSRKVAFSASTVHMQGQPTACAAVAPPFVMMNCGDPVSAPTGIPVTSIINNVTVGMSIADIIMGIVDIVVSMAIDAIFECLKIKAAKKAAKEVGKKATKEVADKAAKQVMNEAIDKMCPTSGLGWIKKGVTTLAGFATSGISDWATDGGSGPATVKVGLGAPAGGGEVSWNTDTGFGVSGQAGGTKVTGDQEKGWSGEQWGSQL